MKNFMNILGSRYNSVRTKDCDNDTFESLAVNRRNLTRQFSIVDSFFHQRKEGERTRYPKGKHATALKAHDMFTVAVSTFYSVWNFIFMSFAFFIPVYFTFGFINDLNAEKVHKLKIYS